MIENGSANWIGLTLMFVGLGISCSGGSRTAIFRRDPPGGSG
jgi:hypothetical protein